MTRLAGRHESIVDYIADNRVENFIVLDDEVAQFPEGWASLVASPYSHHRRTQFFQPTSLSMR